MQMFGTARGVGDIGVRQIEWAMPFWKLGRVSRGALMTCVETGKRVPAEEAEDPLPEC